MNRCLKILSLCCLLIWGLPATGFAQMETEENKDEKMVKAIFDEALQSGETYQLLDYLCNTIGPRLSGSENAAKAVQWTRQVMESFPFDNVFLQSVMVPHWERGAKEIAQIVPKSGNRVDLNVLAIGGSVPTADDGILAEVVEVQSLDEVAELGREKIAGKIVFYNRAFDQRVIRTGAGYGGAVDQRARGASRAAEFGALGIVIRSVTSSFDDQPHTGTLIYADSLPKIPAAALGFQSADKLTDALKNNPALKLFLKINSKWFEDAPSHNVIGELKGSENPDEIILVGGHLDSWDVGHGAHDDGAGCMHSIIALRTLQKIGYKPRHTLRAVMFMNEENGTRGGKKYAELAVQNGENHLVLIESDAGGFSPRGFGVTAEDSSLEKMRNWLPLFPRETISFFNKGGGGVDIGPLHKADGSPMIGFMPDSQRMFDVHHSANDTFDSVNRRELELGTASIAALIYLIDQYGM
ncbi:MAG: M20/M25/M40 family metallo-hydrolase [Calditrichaeota bacterium]|nr:M20/M25/M40 family metallo-hydrolase [Calditrichota bacterium]